MLSFLRCIACSESRTDSCKSATVIFLAHANLVKFLIADQRIGNISERALNGLPVGD